MNNTITYEFPLNERFRVFIRLEQLFLQFVHFSAGTSMADKRAAIAVLLDIMSIFKRNDLKSEILKELSRQASVLNKMASSEGVDKAKLDVILDQLGQLTKKIQLITGKIGDDIIDNALFKSIAQRSSIPGGTCSFDLPEYHYWLEQEASICADDLRNWGKPFIEIHTAIDFMLNFIRHSRSGKAETAITGFFQITLDKNQPFQLIKVTLDSSLPYFAEISGGKHRCNIRFMETIGDNNRPTQSTKDIPFTLTCCLF